jgi:hypothetical protein
MRTPDPSVILCIGPASIRVEIFAAPNVVVVILRVVAEALGKIAFPLVNPVVPVILRGSKHFPLTSVLAIDNKICRAAITQSKAGGLGINSSPSPLARAQANMTVFTHIDAIETAFLHSHRGLRRINFEELFIRGKLSQAN